MCSYSPGCAFFYFLCRGPPSPVATVKCGAVMAPGEGGGGQERVRPGLGWGRGGGLAGRGWAGGGGGPDLGVRSLFRKDWREVFLFSFHITFLEIIFTKFFYILILGETYTIPGRQVFLNDISFRGVRNSTDHINKRIILSFKQKRSTFIMLKTLKTLSTLKKIITITNED